MSNACIWIKGGSKIQGGKNVVLENVSKLSPEDQKLAGAQRFCAVQNGVRLGAMGTSVKIMVKSQPVFLCCKACEEHAQSNPDQTLAKVEELKAEAVAPGPK
jgi:hypothetical protein